MARLSDVIEGFIKEMFIESGDDNVQIQRNELADQFRCAPSQINYVLTTRFTTDKGYLIESRRGGGGYIVIKQLSFSEGISKSELIYESIGSSITYHKSVLLINNLVEGKHISLRESEIMKISLNERSLLYVEDKNKVRAEILKGMVRVIFS